MKRSELLRAAACLAILFTVPVGASAQSVTGQRVECVDGVAAGFECGNVDLLSMLTLEDLGSPIANQTSGQRFPLNDMWGWYDDESGREFALVGRNDGTSFVDVTDPLNPFLVGTLPAHVTQNQVQATWRDLKVYADHAFIVADGFEGHGMQVFNLKRLLTVNGDPVEFDEDAHYDGVNKTHNIFINEDTGFAYLVGTNGASQQPACGPGLHIVDVSTPTQPQFAACFVDPEVGRSLNGYIHDVQCAIYDGPDPDHQGREICVGSGETAVTITDVTDKTDIFTIGMGTYPTANYVHQGWMDAEQQYFYQNDELDEYYATPENGLTQNTETMVWDLTDLDDPVLVKEYVSDRLSIDHNNYVRGNFLLQSNYTSGLIILDITDRDEPVEAAFFDVFPGGGINFNGTWSNYPYFRSGAVGVTSRTVGFFMLAPTIDGYSISVGTEQQPRTTTLLDVYPNPFTESTTVEFEVDRSQDVRVKMFDMLGREVAAPFDGPVAAGERKLVDVQAGALPAGVYVLKFSGEDFVSTTSVVLTR